MMSPPAGATRKVETVRFILSYLPPAPACPDFLGQELQFQLDHCNLGRRPKLIFTLTLSSSVQWSPDLSLGTQQTSFRICHIRQHDFPNSPSLPLPDLTVPIHARTNLLPHVSSGCLANDIVMAYFDKLQRFSERCGATHPIAEDRRRVADPSEHCNNGYIPAWCLPSVYQITAPLLARCLGARCPLSSGQRFECESA